MEARAWAAGGVGIGSRPVRWAAAFAVVAVLAAAGAWQRGDRPARLSAASAAFAAVDQEDSATAPLRRMSRRLAAASSFTFSAVRQMDAELQEGRDVPDSAAIQIEVKRPDKMHAMSRSPGLERHFYFDGRTVTVYDATKKFYATEPVEGTIDDMIRFLDERFSFVPPLAEFVANDPWSFLAPQVGTATLGATQSINGRPCRMVTMRGELADANLWVAVATDLPCGLAATFTQKEGNPRLRAAFSNWNLDAEIPASRFVFRPPPGARQIPMMPMPAAGD